MSTQGNGGVKHEYLIDTVVLTFNRTLDTLEIGGKCNSLTLLLDILGRATRVIENKWKLEQVQALRTQLDEEKRTQAILDSIKVGRG